MNNHEPGRTVPSLAGFATTNPLVPPSIPDHELLRPVGRGAYGEVWLARHTRLGTLRAVKIIRRDQFDDARPFQREFDGIRRYEPISRGHLNLVAILHVGGTDECFYYVMELADDSNAERKVGGAELVPAYAPHSSLTTLHSTYSPHTLRSELKHLGPLPLDRCLEIGRALAGALAHLHARGLVHRDVKPSNVIFVSGVPKLADIGLVAAVSESRSFVGTEGYIPPEGPGTPSADCYALGKLLYELSTGHERTAWPEPPADLPARPDRERLLELNAILHKACAPISRERYRDAEEMHADLLLLQAGRSVKRLHALERRVAIATKAGLVAAGLLVMAAIAYAFAVSQTRRVEREQRLTQRLLYASDMNVARQALDAGNILRAKALLEEYQPKSGGDDLRDFAWFHLSYRCRDDPAMVLSGHTNAVRDVAISRDGTTLASCGSDHSIRLWNLATGQMITTLARYSRSVNSVEFSPDGKWLAAGSSDGSVKLWDLGTGRENFTLNHSTNRVLQVAFSPNGQLLAAGDENRTVRVFDLAQRTKVHAFTHLLPGIAPLSFSPDSRSLATAGEDFSLWIYDVRTGQRTAQLLNFAAFNQAIAFAPDGKTLAAAMGGNRIALWDIDRREVVGTFSGHSLNVLAIAFSSDGARLATVGEDATVRVWDVASHRTLMTLRGHTNAVNAVAFTPDGRTLISGGDDSMIRVWNLDSFGERDVLRGHSEGAYRIALSPDDAILASGSRDQTIKLWDAVSGRELATLRGHTDVVTDVVFAPDGLTLYSSSLDRSIRVWNLQTRECVGLLTNQTEGIQCLALSPDGRTLVAGTGWWTHQLSPSRLTFWDVTNRRPIANREAHSAMVRHMQFFPDGTALVTSDDHLTTKVWDVASGQIRTTITNRSAWAISPDGHSWMLTEADGAGKIEVREVSSDRITTTIPDSGILVSAAAFIPNGKTLAVLYQNGEIRLWDLASGRDTATLSGHEHLGYSVAFSRQGDFMVTCSLDYTVRIWRAPQ